VAFRGDAGTQLWFANLRDRPVEVWLDVSAPKSLWVLDEASFADAVTDPGFGERKGAAQGERMTLQPYAVARVDL
jgi:hypothetical protein